MKRNMLILSLVLLLIMLLTSGCPKIRPVSGYYYLEIEPGPRSFRLFVPSSYDGTEPMPLVIVLHAFFQNAWGAAWLTGFEELAEERGFIVMFPDSLLGLWLMLPHDYELPYLWQLEPLLDIVDDVAFISALIDTLSEEINIDQTRVYATGASNGGMMSYLLAMELSDRIAAAATVMTTMPEDYLSKQAPSHPVPMLIMHGSDDPVIPYEGGGMLGLVFSLDWNLQLEDLLNFGFLSAEETAMYWASRNQTDPTPLVATLPDVDPKDGATVSRLTYTGGLGGSEVVFYIVEGGGHTWPGGRQYLPGVIVGNTCRDIDASTVIWEFFERFRRE